MSTYSDFYDGVIPDVPGVTTSVAELAIKNTVIDFCEQSLILQRDHEPVTVIANVNDYDFEPETGELVVKVMRAWYKSFQLTQLAPDDIGVPEIYNRAFPTASTSTSDPQYILQKDERTFTLYPMPAETVGSAITMRVALKPTRAATTINDVLLEDYFEIISAGAKYRLLLSQGKPYTSPQLAAVERDIYVSGINKAKQRATRGHLRSDLSVKYRTI